MDTYEKNALNFVHQFALQNLTFSNTEKLDRSPKPDALIVVGMGGSGLIGSLLQNLALYVKLTVPVIPWKNFGLPTIPYARRPFYLFISFSGNTKEVLDAFQNAVTKKGTMIAIVAGGGELAARALQHKLPLATFEQRDLEPRQGTGVMLYGALGMLKRVWPDIRIPKLKGTIRTKVLREYAQRIAALVGRNNVAVFAEAADSHLAYYWKAHLNETAKTFASWNVLPELNHNEIVGFELKPKNFIALFLEGDPRDGRARKIREVTRTVLKRSGTPSMTIRARGKDALERTAHSLALAGLVSVEIAKLKGVDARETRIISEIKSRISNFR